MAERRYHRFIHERIVIRGWLVLESPAHFGSGEANPLTDMPVILNEVDNRPLLPGTSIAGALRNYLREFELGDGIRFPDKESGEFVLEKERERSTYSVKLFGGYRGDDEGSQSPLVIHDSLAEVCALELRDGVAINSDSKTAKEDQKFDIELLSAGTVFPLQFELAVSQLEDRETLLTGLVTALMGLQNSEITLGARKRRGFGRCSMKRWEVTFYDLKTPSGLLNYLTSERGSDWKTWSQEPKSGPDISRLLGAPALATDARNRFTMKAVFSLDGTLLIRSGFGEADTRADMVHLHAAQVGKEGVPVIPGTSWAGVLRHQALKIARTLSKDQGNLAVDFVSSMFGPAAITGDDRNARASRITIAESPIQKVKSLEITRLKIDRFTGGAFESALFSEVPVVGTPETQIELKLFLRTDPDKGENDQQAEVGLLLLVLKDLWTGLLPVGGESGIGRGYLKGLEAVISVAGKTWTITGNENGSIDIAGDGDLQDFVNAFKDRMAAHEH